MMTTLSPYAGSGYPTTNTANPEYNNTAIQNTQQQQKLSQAQLNQLNQRLTYSPTSYNWSPQNTTNSATQNNNMLSNQNLNQTQNQFLKLNQNLNQTYSPTSYNNLTYNPQTATQNNNTQQYLKQIYSPTNSLTQNLNQAQYTQNNTANTQNNLTNNTYKAVYNYYLSVTNNPQVAAAATANATANVNVTPPPPVYPPTPTPEPPKDNGGGFPWWILAAGVLGIGAFTNGFGLFGGKGEDKKVDASASANANANANASTSVVTTHNPRPAEPPPLKPDVHYRRRRKEEPPTHGKQPGSNTYHIYGDPFIRVNGGKEVESLGGIPEKGGTKEILLGDTDEGTKVSATYVRSFVDNKHGKPMESIKDLTLTFADGKAIGINTNAKGTTVNVRGKHYDISKDGEYTSGDHCISVKNKVVTITTVDSAEVYTINLGQYTEHENQTKLGPNYLELKAQNIRDFKDGEFDKAEVPSTGRKITSEDSESSYSMRLDNNRRSYAVPIETREERGLQERIGSNDLW